MSFIYHAPLQLLVAARCDRWPLQFHETATLLLKYVDDNYAVSHKLDEETKGAPRQLPIVEVFRSDGTTSLDPAWWRITDLGPVPQPQRIANVRAARLEFLGLNYSHQVAKNGKMSAEDAALHDAFVEQDSIQLLVKLHDAQLGRDCEASLVVKLLVDGQGRNPHPQPQVVQR